MRISGGEWCGRRVSAPRRGVRPTQDSVREAVFSMLQEVVPGCRFLDLFAGSGVVGLDAASRGAAAVWWVERHARTFTMLKRSVAGLVGEDALERPDRAYRCVRGDAVAFLRAGGHPPFDVVFADPPYAQASRGGAPAGCLLLRLLDASREGGLLRPGGIFVMEQRVGAASVDVAGWSPVERTYGTTLIRMFRDRRAR